MTARLTLPTTLLLLLCAVAAKAQPPADSAAMANKLFAAIHDSNWEGFRGLLPSAKMARAMSKKEKKKKLKDKQVMNLIEGRVRDGFNGILASAKENGVELQTLEFVRFQTFRPWEGADRPIALEVFYRWQGREGSLSFSVMEFKGGWYLLEILRSVKVFDKVATE
jgi:hypothetical protein